MDHPHPICECTIKKNCQIHYSKEYGSYFSSTASPQSWSWDPASFTLYWPPAQIIFRISHVSKLLFHGLEFKTTFSGPCWYKTFLLFLCCQIFKLSLRKMPKFHLISWCGNFVERQSFHTFSSESPKTIRKLCLSTKFPNLEITWDYGILRSIFDWRKIEYLINHITKYNICNQKINAFFKANLLWATPDLNWQKKQKLSHTLRLNVCCLKTIVSIKYVRLNEVIWLMTVKIELKMKNRSYWYDVNRPRPRHGHKYIKYKMWLNIMMTVCIKQYLSNIWSSIDEKVKQHWDWVEKKRCL